MNDNRISTYTATPADAAFAAEFNAQQRPAPADPMLSEEHLLAEASNPTDTITLANGASLKIVRQEPARTLVVGEGDPHRYITDTKIEALQRQADFFVERLSAVTDPATGQPRIGCETDHAKLVMQLHQLQRTAAFEQTYGEAARRAGTNDASSGLAQMKAEAEYQDRKTADATARALDEMFGKVNIV